jgi:hypothetical protein
VLCRSGNGPSHGHSKDAFALAARAEPGHRTPEYPSDCLGSEDEIVKTADPELTPAINRFSLFKTTHRHGPIVPAEKASARSFRPSRVQPPRRVRPHLGSAIG